MSPKKKRITIKKFVKQCLDSDIFSPTEMMERYNKQYGLKGDKGKTRFAFTKAMRRLGISAKDRLRLKDEGLKEKEVLDISEYPEVKSYLGQADFQQIGSRQKKKTLTYLRRLWQWMGCTNPRLWRLQHDDKELSLLECMKEHIGLDEQGQWKKQNHVLEHLGAFNRCFLGILPKGYSMGLKRQAGELKDFWELSEYEEFEHNLCDTPDMSREGWIALYSAQISMGAREGIRKKNGILGLLWQNINFTTKRCKLFDKGKKGKPSILWDQVPLDMFYFLNAWNKLMTWHKQTGYKTKGHVFPVTYNSYRKMFHNTRHKCKSRIKDDTETQVPHILRKTHAQWSRRIGVTLDNLCGDTSTYPHIARYGVGWTDPKVPRQYYLTKEAWEYEEQENTISQRLEKPLNELGFKIYGQNTITSESPILLSDTPKT